MPSFLSFPCPRAELSGDRLEGERMRKTNLQPLQTGVPWSSNLAAPWNLLERLRYPDARLCPWGPSMWIFPSNLGDSNAQPSLCILSLSQCINSPEKSGIVLLWANLFSTWLNRRQLESHTFSCVQPVSICTLFSSLWQTTLEIDERIREQKQTMSSY